MSYIPAGLVGVLLKQPNGKQLLPKNIETYSFLHKIQDNKCAFV